MIRALFPTILGSHTTSLCSYVKQDTQVVHSLLRWNKSHLILLRLAYWGNPKVTKSNQVTWLLMLSYLDTWITSTSVHR